MCLLNNSQFSNFITSARFGAGTASYRGRAWYVEYLCVRNSCGLCVYTGPHGVLEQTLLGAINGVQPSTREDPDSANKPMPEEEVRALLRDVLLPDYARLERLGREVAAADNVCPHLCLP
jgi:hypothetical protein